MKDEEFLKALGSKIKEERTKKGLKQIDLAIALNMEDSSLRRIENGRTNTTALMLRKICKELNISLAELVEGL